MSAQSKRPLPSVRVVSEAADVRLLDAAQALVNMQHRPAAAAQTVVVVPGKSRSPPNSATTPAKTASGMMAPAPPHLVLLPKQLSAQDIIVQSGACKHRQLRPRSRPAVLIATSIWGIIPVFEGNRILQKKNFAKDLERFQTLALQFFGVVVFFMRPLEFFAYFFCKKMWSNSCSIIYIVFEERFIMPPPTSGSSRGGRGRGSKARGGGQATSGAAASTSGAAAFSPGGPPAFASPCVDQQQQQQQPITTTSTRGRGGGGRGRGRASAINQAGNCSSSVGIVVGSGGSAIPAISAVSAVPAHLPGRPPSPPTTTAAAAAGALGKTVMSGSGGGGGPGAAVSRNRSSNSFSEEEAEEPSEADKDQQQQQQQEFFILGDLTVSSSLADDVLNERKLELLQDPEVLAILSKALQKVK